MDYFFNSQDTLCCILASVPTKGLPAAILMDRVTPLLHELLRSGHSPARALENCNHIICSYRSLDKTNISPAVSVFICTFRPDDHALVWAAAGSTPSFILSPEKVEILPRSLDIPLGVSKNAVYSDHFGDLKPGQSLFVSDDRLIGLFKDGTPMSAEESFALILKKFRAHPAQTLAAVHDSATALALAAGVPRDIAMLSFSPADPGFRSMTEATPNPQSFDAGGAINLPSRTRQPGHKIITAALCPGLGDVKK